MPTPSSGVQGSAAQPVTVTPQQCRDLLPGDWITTGTAFGNLNAKASRTANVGEPQTSGQSIIFRPQTGSAAIFEPLLRGSAGDTAEGRLWGWDEIARPGKSGAGTPLMWSPFCIGAWTFTAATQTGIAGGAVLNTDRWCSSIAVLSSLDRRGDYPNFWRIIQPGGAAAATDDGGRVCLLVDGFGFKMFEWELRIPGASSATGVFMSHRWVNGA